MAKLSAKDEEFLLMADNRLDRRLIEGILTDRDATIQEIREKYDVSEAGVLRRASELGLSEAMLRHAKGVAADLSGDPDDKETRSPSNGGPQLSIVRSGLSLNRPRQSALQSLQRGERRLGLSLRGYITLKPLHEMLTPARTPGYTTASAVVTVAQLVEHWFVVPVVAGSSPVSHPTYPPSIIQKSARM